MVDAITPFRIVRHRIRNGPSMAAAQISISAFRQAQKLCPAVKASVVKKWKSLSHGDTCVHDDGEIAGFFAEAPMDAAVRAFRNEAFSLRPAEWYVELVAAVADDCELLVIDSHGWPILSVVPCMTTVAEVGGGATAPDGCEAARHGEAA